jgi:predicted TIM-barrel fold metal-dependent hydrolase
MLSRRDLLIGTLLGVAKASQPATPIAFDVPRGACDCHTHVFGDPRQFPFAPTRTYTPEPASVDELLALQRTLHLDRVVIVQPSVYGTDNRCTLDAIARLGRRARGVAVIDDKTTDADLDDMNRRGIRGIRINLETAGQTDPSLARQRFQAAVARVEPRRWHIQIYTRPSIVEALQDAVAAAPVPIVFDHFGGALASGGVEERGFAALTNLVRAGTAYVKISAAYRVSNRPPDYLDAAPLAKALIAANPQRVLWGTDWPHPDSVRTPGRTAADLAPLLQVDDGRVFNQLAAWAPRPAERQIILVDNPARLYGF